MTMKLLSLFPSLLAISTVAACAQLSVEPVARALEGFTACAVISYPDPESEQPGTAGNRALILNPAMAQERASPCSTFKIPNTLIGLETGVITGPEFTLPWDGTQRVIEVWNQDHQLRGAFQNSVVWWYQELARRIGAEPMDAWLTNFNYGNRDTSGGIDQFWLGSTLTISAEEQVTFLTQLVEKQLPITDRTREILLATMRVEERGGAVLYGKTGSDGDLASGKMTLGWYVGFIEHTATPGQYTVFAFRIVDGDNPSGPKVRELAKTALSDLKLWPGE